ncbi:MAG: exopolysaccharide biosynthesis polyprenyl glycosylphosphotransferase [Desulfobacteraceae bacterium]|nr:MAG: exopolysaccharide biosynthesis polyprenyl glycosylphosphotransferase [Desulfobacteraceae bacterium]
MAADFSGEQALDLKTIWAQPRLYANGLLRRGFELSRWLLAFHDILLSVAAWFFCAWALESFPLSQLASMNNAGTVLVYAALTIALFSSLELYSRHLIFSRRNHVGNMLKAFGGSLFGFFIFFAVYVMPAMYSTHKMAVLLSLCAVGMAALLWMHFVSGGPWYLFKVFGFSLLSIGVLEMLGHGATPLMLNDSSSMALGFGAAFASLVASRMFVVHFVFNRVFRRYFRQQVALIGTDEQARQIATHIIDRNAPFWVTGTIGDHCQLTTNIKKDCLGPIERLPGIIGAHKIEEILITDKEIDKRSLICVLDFCLTNGITVWFPPNLLEIIDRKLHIDNFCGLPMIKMCSPKRIWIFSKFKHAVDAIISLPLFMLLLPLFGFIAAAIKLNSKGPVFYKARAIGKSEREFGMLKFRSMKVNNGSAIHKDYVTKLIKGEICAQDGKPLKITDDPRVTSVGKLLRKFSLDELPQLINVITGQMSLVGPRPCLPYEYELYKDWQKKRTCVRPGITGLWQVAGRSEVAFEDMILLDLYYIYNRSLWMDLNILIETVFVVLKKKGAY